MTDSQFAERSRLFNTPLECGLRSLAVLAAAHPAKADLQRLSFFDYLIVHSADVAGGPESLHPATPHRSGEFLVRRGMVERGLVLLLSRGLIERCFSVAGIEYVASETAVPFLDNLRSAYTDRLRQVAEWVAEQFGAQSNAQIEKFFMEHLDRWGGEFESEAVLRELL
jgi:hypothetical protein